MPLLSVKLDVRLIRDERTVASALAVHASSARRLRLEISTLLNNPELAAKLEVTTRARPGIVRASADLRSGRLLMEYAADAPLLDELDQYAKETRTSSSVRRRGA